MTAASSFVSEARFADLQGLHPLTLKALAADFKYELMSAPQAAYLPVALSGKDTLVRARTGSGKTLGFLIPLVQRLAAAPSPPQGPNAPVRALVLSPSRELAEQTQREAARLLAHHSGIGVELLIGGSSASADRVRLGRARCDVIVATPGRLEDHLQNTPGFAARMQGVAVLVLDEADRLLDMGFAPAVRRIAAALPSPQSRQSLLFSATLPDAVLGVADAFMRRDRVFVDTAKGDGDGPAASSVHQESLVLPVASLIPALHRVLLRHRAESPDHKIIVFVPTALMAAFLADVFRAAGMRDALELHSRLTQPQRATATRTFGEGKGVLMFASDVVARGIDFADVSLVVQLGMASDPESYTHRVGRSGRAGKSGQALLLLGEDESGFLSLLTRAAITPAAPDSRTAAGIVSGQHVPPEPPLQTVFEGLAGKTASGGLGKAACRAFVASLGFYNSHMRKLRWTPAQLVQNVAARYAAMGVPLPKACPVQAKTLAKMRLKGVPGLEVV